MITVQHTQFRKAALFAASVVSKRQTIPVLSTVKVTANGSLKIEGTDLDTYVSASLPYEGDEGEFLLPEPAKVSKALKSAGGETVSLSYADKKLHVEAGDLTADLSSSQHPDDFPTSETVADEAFAADVGEDFFRALDRVRPAVSTEETRYYLNGIYFQKVGDWLYRATATDGHRLFMVDLPMPGATGDLQEGVIIPRRAVERVIAAFLHSESGVRFTLGTAQKTNRKDGSLVSAGAKSRAGFAAKVGDLYLSLTTKLIDGTYPDVSRVIPTEHPHTVRLNRAALLRALKSIMPLSSDKTRAIKLTLSPGLATLSLQSPDVGTSHFPIGAEHQMAAGFEVGMNARYLLEAVNALGGEEIDLGLSDPAAPLTISDPADLAFKIVQMPMRV